MLGSDSYQPGIQVVIATKNSDRFLNQCLASVVEQTFPPSRITVVDQASADKTREIVAGFSRIELQDQLGSGIPQAWNQGIQSAHTEFVAMIDSDDYWVPTFLSDAIAVLQENPSAEYVVARAKYVVNSERVPPGFRPELIDQERIGWMPGTTLFRRTIFSRVGYFPEDFQIASDIEWYARLRSDSISFAEMEKLALYKRMHGENFSLSKDFAQTYRKEILRVARNRIKGV